MLPALKKGLLFYHTVRHLKGFQVWGRISAVARRKLRLVILPDPPLNLVPRGVLGTALTAHDPWNDAASLKEGSFTFLNVTVKFGAEIDWQAADKSMLWRFNLHYFNWIHLLDDEYRDAFCRSWIDANPVYTVVAWHPYPVSLRIVNWCRAGVAASDILESLYLQAAYLSRHLETYLSGNHVIENARALVVAGAFFENQGEAGRWLEQGLALLQQQFEAQILPDGAHYERSPMYHALMLEACIDVLAVSPQDHVSRASMAKTAASMADFLLSMTCPDGQIALFNDATREIAHATPEIVDRVEALTGHVAHRRSRFDAAGYYVHRSEACYLAIDGGAIGPDHIPAHAHADIFSFEMSIHGVQFFVDAGVFEYEAGAMRDYVRSTRAHNTVTVDGRNQAECWSAFRVGRRMPPRNVRFDSNAEGCRFFGRFEGYGTLIGDRIVHEREIIVDEAVGEMTISDRVTGSGAHRVESRLHLHPEVAVENTADGMYKLTRADVAVMLRTEAEEAVLEKGWYCPEFGRRIENHVISMCQEGRLPASTKCSVLY